MPIVDLVVEWRTYRSGNPQRSIKDKNALLTGLLRITVALLVANVFQQLHSASATRIHVFSLTKLICVYLFMQTLTRVIGDSVEG